MPGTYVCDNQRIYTTKTSESQKSESDSSVLPRLLRRMATLNNEDYKKRMWVKNNTAF